MGLTKVLSSTDYTLPGKWQNLSEPLKVSSKTLHAQLSVLDNEVTEEYYRLEKDLSRKVGRGKLYTEEDLDTARKRIEQVEFQNFKHRM